MEWFYLLIISCAWLAFHTSFAANAKRVEKEWKKSGKRVKAAVGTEVPPTFASLGPRKEPCATWRLKKLKELAQNEGFEPAWQNIRSTNKKELVKALRAARENTMLL